MKRGRVARAVPAPAGIAAGPRLKLRPAGGPSPFLFVASLFGLLSACGPDATDPALVRSTLRLDLSGLHETPSRQEFLSIIESARLLVDGSPRTAALGPEQLDVEFELELAVGPHDFEAEILSNTGIVLYRGSRAGFEVVDDGFQVAVPLQAVRGVLFVAPGEVSVGAGSSADVQLENRGSAGLRLVTGPLRPGFDTCDAVVPCLSVGPGVGFLPAPGSGSFAIRAGAATEQDLVLEIHAFEGEGPDEVEIGVVELPIRAETAGVGTVTAWVGVEGDPLGDVTVLLTDAAGNVSREEITDDQGEATFVDVPLGAWQVWVFESFRTLELLSDGDEARVVFDFIGLAGR